ncbi:uncharacterized protein LOC130266561 [Oenanthe melanoleuca]|uniref:uncharacterized protein LOC130266560 n=1 Tax=Oenanthe melanoleuca TaxID=2939378 RepID=UPI0024C172D6|nr:uncharacterized protein LOC130266560 [Oenanthe melanoleuca]XP_056371791.1 uncharacterized protein LOC130266561 [Oenanthe melanoleuca]
MAGRVFSLFKTLGGKKKKGPAAAPAQQPPEPEQLQPLQHDAVKDRTQEQDPARGRFHRAVQVLRRFLRTRRRKSTATATEDSAQPDCRPSELQAEPGASTESSAGAADSAMAAAEGSAKAGTARAESVASTDTLTGSISDTDSMASQTDTPAPTRDFPQEEAAFSPQQVPAIVRDIHQRLMYCVTVDAGLQNVLVTLADEHPFQVVMSLLCCAPSCDGAAALMWRTIGSSGQVVQDVLAALLSVMESSMFFSREDNEAVFALAATVVLWVTVHVPEWHTAVLLHSARLFVALLFQIFSSTQQMPQGVENVWTACREEHHLPSNRSRFAVQTMKALLCCLGRDEMLVALERKRVWDNLLCADTKHCAVGLLAREMRHGLSPLCSCIATHLLSLPIWGQPRWDLPALAFFVEQLQDKN